VTHPTHFVFLLVENFTHLAFSCVIEPLRIANLVSGRELYRWSLASEDGRTAIASNRTVTMVDRGLTPLNRGERLYLISGIHVQNHASPAILNYLRRERALGTKIGAICSGAYILARAGMLDGMEAAIHWGFHDVMEEAFPDVRLVRSVFVAHEKIVTASGGTAAADLMLHLIAEEHGEELAVTVADQMVYNAVREGTAAQRISLQSRIGARNPHLTRAIRLIEENIENPLGTHEIAEEIGISVRQLERLFDKYLQTSPRKFMVDTRLHRARNLIVQTDQSVSEIAMACGFNSPSHFSRLFRSAFGSSPVAHRVRLA